MKVILSVKPEFAEKIFDGTKQYEFRRVIFKNNQIKKIIVYASSPVQKVIGEFEVEYVLNASLNKLWNTTKDQSGISRTFFLKYFEKKQEGYAIKIKNPKRYRTPKNLQRDFDLSPPQSFVYYN